MIIDFQQENLFLSTGDKHGFYTLRVGGVFTAVDGEGHRYSFYGSEYIKNLSTDKETAIQKAAEYADFVGLPFYSDAEFVLEKIKREKAEETEARRAEQERFRLEKIEAEKREFCNIVEGAVFTVGMYTGCTVDKVAETPRGQDYLRWLARQYDETEELLTKHNANAKMAYEWAKSNPIGTSEWIGSEGDTIKVEGLITKKVWTQGRFSTCMFRIVDGSGNIFIVYSTSKKMVDLSQWDSVSIEAVVKKHENSYYEADDNNKVTVLARPKVK